MSGQPPGSDFPQLLPYWNQFFGEWTSAGSWYGLHSHNYLAVLPAVVQQAKVRKALRDLGSVEWRDEPVYYPGGGLASARYSVANLCGNERNRRQILQAALADVARSFEEGRQLPADLRAVRGSIYRRLCAYGTAVEDYEAVVRLRREADSGGAEVGQAISELGFGYLFRLQLWKGRSYLEEGVRMLGGKGVRPGFLIRAKRKLAIAYWLTGRFADAKREAQEARELAAHHEVRDQLR